MTLEESVTAIKTKSISIEVYGLGYVGFPLAVRLASSGLKIIGIDVNTQRIERLQNNKLMDSETYLEKDYLECRQKK